MERPISRAILLVLFFIFVTIVYNSVNNFLLKIRSNLFLTPYVGLIPKVVIKEDLIYTPAILYYPF